MSISHRFARRGVWLVLAGLLVQSVCLLPATVRSQTVRPAALEPSGAVTPEQRASLRRTLEQNAPVLEAQAAVVKAVAKLIGPTVVHIEAEGTAPSNIQFGHGRHSEEAGSGVIIQWKGKHYVLTDRHVIHVAQPDGIWIYLADGRRIRPQQIWDDADTDVAVLAVTSPALVAAELGDSDRMEIGDFVLAVGSPFGLRHSVTFGIISAKGRRDLHLGDAGVSFQNFLQTDAAINPGNSGGPLCNLRGEVIGINTAIASNSGGSEGIGFSIPVNMFLFIARQLIESGKVTRAYLGVTYDEHFGPAMAAELGLPGRMGARVLGITKGAPAEVAKLLPGDIILQINGIRVEDGRHLTNLVRMIEVGKRVPLVVYRDGKTLDISVEMSERSRFDDSP